MKEDLIKFAPLFAALVDGEREKLVDGFVEGQCSANAMLLKAGDRAEAIYLIGQGFVSLATQSGQNLATLGPGSILGEASLFRSAVLDVSAVAQSDLQFWKLSDRDLRDIILAQPAIGLKLSRSFGSLLVQMQDYLIQRLTQTAELSALPPITLQAVAQHLEPREVEAANRIFAAGDEPLGLFLLEQGSVELRPEAVDIEQSEDVQPGQLFGALALLTGKPYRYDALATDVSLLWVLPSSAFHQISTQHPGLPRSLARDARSRLSKADQGQAVLRLAQMPMFSEAPPQTLQTIAQCMILQHVPAGERVYLRGEAGDALYFVDSGEIELSAESAGGVLEELARIDNGGFFGEMSLLTGQIRTEDATAIRNTNLWILRKADLDRLASQYPEIGKALSQGLATRLAANEQDEGEERFRSFELFADLDGNDLKHVATCLHPSRYREGEQIYRSTSPADALFLLEVGQVRIQPLSGGSWILGPGEAFGERALLTNQPHNASAVAETEVDVWTLSKSDFDVLMQRYPSLAISMSRILSERLAKMDNGMQESAAKPAVAPVSTAVTNMPQRRRPQASYPSVDRDEVEERITFGQWFANLSVFGKIRLAILLLLLVWLLGIAAPAALLSLMQGTTVATGADDMSTRPNLLNAISAVYAVGSYELAAKDQDLAQVLAMADRQVPPTPIATLPPTPTPTPLPTNTPTPVPTPTWTPTQVVVRTFVQPAAVQPTPEPEVVAAAVPARAWDPRLDRLGVYVEDAPAGPGQPYWRIVEAQWKNEQEAGGKHHIYVEVLDENGDRLVGQPVTVYWGDGNHTSPTEDKAPPDFGYNYQMYAAGNAYNVKVEGLPSEILHGAGMGDLERPRYGIHTAFYITFQRAIKP